MMVNKPLKSIKFPGLPDTYIVQQVDPTLTQPGQAADAKSVGDAIASDIAYIKYSGRIFTDNVKNALLDCFEHVAWIDDDGQSYVDALYNALNPNAILTSINATFTQGSAVVTDQDSLDSLKQYLTVTGHYTSDDGSFDDVVTDYTLSGTLTVGTSIVTITYNGKTTAISVTVSEYEDTCIMDGLVAYWDGIDNTSSGHDSSASTWEGLVGNYDLTENGSSCSWNNDSLQFNGSTDVSGYYGDTLWTYSEDATIEMVIAPEGSSSMCIGTFDRASATLPNGNYDARRFSIFSDNTVNFIGRSATSFANPETGISAIKKLVCAYSGFNISKAFVNGIKLPSTPNGNNHSFTYTGSQQIRIGIENFSANASAKYPFNGKIYAIRVYNRILTDDEIAHNLEYDNNRFSLGLTL